MDYNFRDIEQRWQKAWAEQKTYKVSEDDSRKKYYVLNMFPYPSGAGLHVGHPLGYIASDIFARHKRLQGYNVLNPMGYDAYGLPAEQYAIQTGQHPEVTTNANINRYREQLDKIGFCFDWDREVRTCDPKYYHWTQWAFRKMFNSFFCNDCQKAQPIEKLIEHFEQKGTEGLNVACSEELSFTADEWKAMDEKRKSDTLMNYRIAFMGETMVNWCAGLGTVLANDEVVDGLSVRGGFPVEQKKMRQWCLRVSAYAQRLLDGLEKIDWSESIKETQKNWIGRSEGTEVFFKIAENPDTRTSGHPDTRTSENSEPSETPKGFTIFTTRADTMFGVTFMVLAPESELVKQLTTPEQKEEVEKYVKYVAGRTERERQIDHKVTGVFSGSYAINPFTGEKIPIWISEYVLAGYGTGAIMAVPAHDSRDYAFAKHFGLPIIPLIEGADVSEESYDAKEGIVMNSPRIPAAKPQGAEPCCNANTANASSDNVECPSVSPTGLEVPPTGLVLNGLTVKEAIAKTKEYVKTHNLGRVKVNYRLRDAIFSRQRYWGEPFPVYYKNGIPTMIPEECLPIELPAVDKFLPTETGEPPLGNATVWAWDEANRKIVENSKIDEKTVFPIELYTMPGFAGSSAYYLRYMDPHNGEALLSEKAAEYWQNVDLYVGGSEHATGHLIYSRFWNKFLFDLGVSKNDEPFKKLVNQGMIQGRSNFVYRIEEGDQKGKFVSNGLKKDYKTTPIHVDVNIVSNDILDVEAFKAWRPEYNDAEFILEDGKYVCGWAVEKMSKSMFNVVNPDMIVEKYGADTLRLYEMFLGPVEQSKPWDTNGIDGCHRFLKKFWALMTKPLEASGETAGNSAQPTAARPAQPGSVLGGSAAESFGSAAEALKSVHKLIKKVSQDIPNFSYNTAISAFMICVNELTAQKCADKALLENLIVCIAPFAPHIAEELWHMYGHETTVCDARWPEYDEKYLVENTMKLGVSFNGKVRFDIEFPADADNKAIEAAVMADERTAKYLAGKAVNKVIIVPKRLINVVHAK